MTDTRYDDLREAVARATRTTEADHNAAIRWKAMLPHRMDELAYDFSRHRLHAVAAIPDQSATIASLEAQVAGLREALQKIVNGRDKRMPDGSSEMVDLDDPTAVATAALSTYAAKEEI